LLIKNIFFKKGKVNKMADRVIEFNQVNVEQLRLVPLAADPTDVKEGDVWYLASTHKLRLRLASSTIDLN
jgi:hypothetical protein